MSNSSEKLRLIRRSVLIEKALLAREREGCDAKKVRQEKRKRIKALARGLVAAKKNQ